MMALRRRLPGAVAEERWRARVRSCVEEAGDDGFRADAFQLPVFTVSALEYQKLKGLRPTDGRARVWSHVEQTRVHAADGWGFATCVEKVRSDDGVGALAAILARRRRRDTVPAAAEAPALV